MSNILQIGVSLTRKYIEVKNDSRNVLNLEGFRLFFENSQADEFQFGPVVSFLFLELAVWRLSAVRPSQGAFFFLLPRIKNLVEYAVAGAPLRK